MPDEKLIERAQAIYRVYRTTRLGTKPWDQLDPDNPEDTAIRNACFAQAEYDLAQEKGQLHGRDRT